MSLVTFAQKRSQKSDVIIENQSSLTPLKQPGLVDIGVHKKEQSHCDEYDKPNERAEDDLK